MPIVDTPKKRAGSEQQTDVRAWLNDLVVRGDLREELYAEAIKLAEHMLAEQRGGGRLEPADLATGFILHLREQHKLEIETRAGLRKEMRRFLLRTTSPGALELWEALSDALRRLAQKGAVIRLDGKVKEPNGNDVRWCCAGDENGSAVDAYDYEQRCKHLRTFMPARRRDAQVIGPTEAEELAHALLREARAPLAMSLLFGEARRHVILLTQASSLDDTDEAVGNCRRDQILDPDARIDCEVWLSMEAAARGDSAWRRIQREQKGGDRVLCLYLLPARFLEYDAKLEDLGDTRRASEMNRKLLAIIGDEVSIDKLDRESGDDLVAIRIQLLGGVVEHLMKKCSENGMDPHFKSDGTRRMGRSIAQVRRS